MSQRRHAVISGGGQGFGLTLARTFLKNGFDITICGRNELTLSEACKELHAQLKEQEQPTSNPLKIDGIVCDISSPQNVSNFWTEILERSKIDVLINNASVLGPIGEIDQVDAAQWLNTIQINLFGTMLMCQGILPHFKEMKRGHIINLSGGGATSPRPLFSAYAASKAAVVRLTETIAEEMKPYGVAINAVAPGVMPTAMVEKVAVAGEHAVGAHEYKQYLKSKEAGLETMAKAAELCLYLANLEGTVLTGKLISAVWDDWRNLAESFPILGQSDIYNLRRITPEDRPAIWEKK